MSESFNSESIEGLRVRLVRREAQSETTRTRAEHVRDAALGFFGVIGVALTVTLTLNAVFYKEPGFQALGLRGAILPEEVAALFAEADVAEEPE